VAPDSPVLTVLYLNPVLVSLIPILIPVLLSVLDLIRVHLTVLYLIPVLRQWSAS